MFLVTDIFEIIDFAWFNPFSDNPYGVIQAKGEITYFYFNN